MVDQYYLAHPSSYRELVRKWELEFEDRTGIQLFNPFYDGIEADQIKPLDEGKVTAEEYCNDPIHLAFPQWDLDQIRRPDIKGVVAIYPPVVLLGQHLDAVAMVGTPAEMMSCKYVCPSCGYSLGKPVYVITQHLKNHLWFQYFGYQVFATTQEFEDYMNGARIAFIGKMGDGKTTAAQYLVKNYRFSKYAFADKLKEIAHDLYDMPYDKKDRVLLQKLGTDAIRNQVDQNTWVNYLARKIGKEDPRRAVVDDCRFLNEAEALRSKNFIIVRVKRTTAREAAGIDVAGTQTHASELEVEKITADFVLEAANLSELYSKIDSLLKILDVSA